MIDEIRQANLGRPGIHADEHGDPAGDDPRNLSESQLAEIGHAKSPLIKVIRAKCLDCCCGSLAEIRDCIITTCPLWPYRMSANPFHKKSMTDEQKAAAGSRLRESRERASRA